MAPELLTGAMIRAPSQTDAHLESEHAYAGSHLEGEHAHAGSQKCKPTNTLSVNGYNRSQEEKCPHGIQVACSVFVWHL